MPGGKGLRGAAAPASKIPGVDAPGSPATVGSFGVGSDKAAHLTSFLKSPNSD